MSDGLTDEQLKEFDAYLNGAQPPARNDGDDDVTVPPAPLPRPEQKVVDDDAAIVKADTSYLDKIVDLHSRKADDIMALLDKIDAKGHKDIVADLVDEMQYQKSVVKRERDQLGQLQDLFDQAAKAAKK